MSREENPNWLQLTDWVDGRLSPAEAESIKAELANRRADHEDSFSADVAWLQAFWRAARDLSLDEPPQELRTALRAMFADYAEQQAASEERPPGLIERLVAALTFDSGMQPLAAGARAADGVTTRQLIFSTAQADIMLSLYNKSPEVASISGRILPLTAADLELFGVQLFLDDRAIASTHSDSLGTFTFDDVPPNTYELTLSTDSLILTTGSFELH